MSGYAGEPNRARFPDLLKKSEDYLNDALYPVVKNWPTAEKFCLCQDTKHACASMLHAIVQANNLSSRKSVQKYLEIADSEKTWLLICLKTANRQRYITDRTLAHHQALLKDIGSLIGGAMGYINNFNQKAPAQ